MTQAQIFAILNELINAYNATEGAVADSLTDGKIDYDKLVNRPSINGVTLEAELSQAELEISMDAETIQRLVSMESRVAGTETAETNNDARIQTLEGFKTTYKGYVDTLRTQRTADRGDIDTLQSQRTTDSGRIDLLDERYSAVHTTQTSEQSKVATLQEQMPTKAKQADLTEVVHRLVKVVDRLNVAVHSIQRDESACSTGEILPAQQCVQDISNTFDFDY
jgi:chromosome segregation ATPase